jgi:hypothetical protein
MSNSFVLHHTPNRARLQPESLKNMIARYGPQLAIYAEALEGIRGARVSESYLFLLGEGICLRI